MRDTWYLDQAARKVEAIEEHIKGRKQTKTVKELAAMVEGFYVAQREHDFEEACRQWVSDILDNACDSEYSPSTNRYIKSKWIYDRN